MNSYIIAVDIGNTNTDIGLIDPIQATCLKRCSYLSDDTDYVIKRKIGVFYDKNGIDKEVPVIVCSVVQQSLDKVKRVFFSRFGREVSLFKYHKNLPLHVHYKKPELLGADRIANCLYGLRKFPGENIIIIDVGTAVTVDVLTAKGEFQGGYIFPGPKTQLQSLHLNTSQLPRLDLLLDSISTPPDSTEDAMAGGACYAVAGALSFIVQKIIHEVKIEYKILSCGGGWRFIENLIDFDYTFNRDITLIGVALFEKKWL